MLGCSLFSHSCPSASLLGSVALVTLGLGCWFPLLLLDAVLLGTEGKTPGCPLLLTRTCVV